MPSSKAKDIHGFAGEGLVEELDNKYYSSAIQMLIQKHVYKCYLREVNDQWSECIERNNIERKINDDMNLIVFSEVAKDTSSNQEFALASCQGGEAEEHCLRYSTFGNKRMKQRAP